ncbi:MAG: cell division protein FtsZ [Arenicella sp.]|jgi:cell division protein FtsZ
MKNTLVVGFGGAGMSIAKHIRSFLDCDALAVDTNASDLNQSGFESLLLIGPDVCKGIPAGMHQRGLLAAKESVAELEKALASHETIVLVAGLGGGTGTGALRVAAKLLALQKKCLVVAVTLPFSFEKARRDTALDALTDLQSRNQRVLVYDNELLLQNIANHRATLPDVFERSTHKIAEDVRTHLTSAA